MHRTIQAFRRFNRFYTRILGLFNKSLPGGTLPLAEARTLYEIAADPGVNAAGLAQRLAMDRGQLSRIVARLIKRGLIERAGTPRGRTPLPLRPTGQGLALMDRLNAASDDQAARLIGHLDQRGRARLRAALAEARGLLSGAAPGPGPLRIRPAASGELGWIITRHARVYGEEWGFSEEFERYVLLGLAEYLDSGCGAVWIAELDGSPVGSVGIVPRPDGSAQLRWLLVEPAARGLGAGRALVAEAVDFCKTRGHARIYLWTLADLDAARALYQSLGFVLAEEKQGTMGGKPMVEERWVLDLAGAGRDRL